MPHPREVAEKLRTPHNTAERGGVGAAPAVPPAGTCAHPRGRERGVGAGAGGRGSRQASAGTPVLSRPPIWLPCQDDPGLRDTQPLSYLQFLECGGPCTYTAPGDSPPLAGPPQVRRSHGHPAEAASHRILPPRRHAPTVRPPRREKASGFLRRLGPPTSAPTPGLLQLGDTASTPHGPALTFPRDIFRRACPHAEMPAGLPTGDHLTSHHHARSKRPPQGLAPAVPCSGAPPQPCRGPHAGDAPQGGGNPTDNPPRAPGPCGSRAARSRLVQAVSPWLLCWWRCPGPDPRPGMELAGSTPTPDPVPGGGGSPLAQRVCAQSQWRERWARPGSAGGQRRQ